MEGGSVAVVAATRESSGLANDFMIQAFVDCIWPHMLSDFPTAEDTEASELETSHRLGDALNYAKFYIAHKIHGDYTAPFEVYHLFGDPTMEIWTASPHPVLPDRFFDPVPVCVFQSVALCVFISMIDSFWFTTVQRGLQPVTQR